MLIIFLYQYKVCLFIEQYKYFLYSNNPSQIFFPIKIALTTPNKFYLKN